MPHEYDPDALLAAESDIRRRLEGKPVDIEVQHAISNLYRAATVVSRSAEREVLAAANLSWSGFTVLWVLWVWGRMDSTRLAGELGLTAGSLTGIRRGLEKQGLVSVSRDPDDGRRMQTILTPAGEKVIERVYPQFNSWAASMLDGLQRNQINELATLLQAVVVRPSGDQSPT